MKFLIKKKLFFKEMNNIYKKKIKDKNKHYNFGVKD